VPPTVFIPICEECGLMDAIGDWVLLEAARQQVRWAELGCNLRVAVNLSVMQFNSPVLLETCRQVLEETGCEPGKLELEVTESMLLGNDERTLATLDGLRALGFRLAIDDFGTGYSNLAYLQRYPFSSLKIDRSFIAALDSGTPIAELVISLCHLLGMDIVAEGVESQHQLEWLHQRNCHTYQGFLYSPALPAEQFLQQICRR
jgi:EAL domain-containing protein (putative c-di-GMP-specific phosphodiesterase class I)